jgi:hypothetical protein
LSENYIIEVSVSIFGHTITREEDYLQILVMIDKEFNYLKHKVLDYKILCIASNDSNMFCIDYDGNFYYYDMRLELVAERQYEKIRETVDTDFDDVVMNNSHLFILCINDERKTLRIFDLITFDLVNEIGVEGDVIKPVLTSHLILFDSTKKFLYLHNQSGDFEKIDQVDMNSSLDGDEIYFVYADKSLNVLFHDMFREKFVSFGQLFKNPLISS